MEKELRIKRKKKEAEEMSSPGKKTFGQYVLAFFLMIYTLFCALPVVLVFVAAFSSEDSISRKGFSFFPDELSLDGMHSVLKYGNQLITSYGVTIFVVVVGTALGLLTMSMYAYAISRPGFRLAKFLSIYLLIPMLFNGGQLAGYIVFTSYYHLKNSLLLLILPLCVTTMNVLILRTYIVNSIPAELLEAAKIDGANEYVTFFGICLPLMKPSLAAVGFMMATAYWNDWQNALLYIDKNSKKPLQLLLYNIQKNIDFLLNSNNVPQAVRDAMGGAIPKNSATMATVVVVIAPIMVAYPFFQKYFEKGLTVGSVKG